MSPGTLRAYRQDLARFLRYCAAHGLTELSDLRPADLAAYAAELGRTLAVRTHRRCLCTLRDAARHWRAAGLLSLDLCADLALPRLSETVPEALSTRQAARLLDSADPQTPHGARDRALLELLYSSGLRIAEACALRLRDLGGPVLRVRGKGGRQRLVPVGQPAQAALLHYLQWARPQLCRCPSSCWVFPNRWGKPLSTRWARELVYRAARRGRFRRRVWPHLLRHTFASHLLWEGCELPALQLLLGHASLATTQIYTHCARPHLWRVYRRCHPRA